MPVSPPFTIDGISCEVYTPDDGAQAITETYGPGGPTATMIIKCDWGDRQRVIRRLLGRSTETGRVINQIAPLQYADAPGNLWVCTSVDVSGIGFATNQETGFGFYQEAVLQCHFTVPLYDPVSYDDTETEIQDLSGIPFCETSIRTSTEVFVPANKATFFFSGDAGRPLENSRVGLLQVHFEVEAVRRFMPLPLVQAIGTLSGKVNTNAITFGDQVFQPEQVLFLMGEVTPTAEPATGFRVWDLPLRFLCNRLHTWNQFLNEKGVYEVVQTTGAAPMFPYDKIDLALIFDDTF